MRRSVTMAMIGVYLSALPLAPQAGATDTPAQSAGCALELPFGDPVRVVRVTGPNTFVVADGREVRLAGITTPHRWTPAASTPDGIMPDDVSEPDTSKDGFDPVRAADTRLQSLLSGHDVRLAPVSPIPDRYGRLRARVTIDPDRQSLERILVAEGLARVEPDKDDFGCARSLEDVETAARVDQRGLWALPEFAVIAADDAEARRAALGRYVIVEGTLVSRGASGNRHYLNFGKNFRRDFAVVLVNKDTNSPRGKAKRIASRFETEGFDSSAAIGRNIRVRGVLMPGGGGLIWPDVPEAIEWSDR